VAEYRVEEGQRRAVVHEARVNAHAPERRGTNLQASRLPAVLDEAVAQKVERRAEGSNLSGLLVYPCGEERRHALYSTARPRVKRNLPARKNSIYRSTFTL
jgi:hypothetical protein